MLRNADILQTQESNLLLRCPTCKENLKIWMRSEISPKFTCSEDCETKLNKTSKDSKV